MKIDARSPEYIAYKRAQTAERESQDRIAQAEKTAAEAEASSRHRIDADREQYSAIREKERQNHNASLEDEQQKNYKAIRNLQQQHAREANRLKRDQETEMADLKQGINQEIHIVETRGEEMLRDLLNSNHGRVEYERKNALDQEQSLKANHLEAMGLIKNETEAQLNAAKTDQTNRLEAERQKTFDANMQAEEHFKQAHRSVLDGHNKILADTFYRSVDQLDDLRDHFSKNIDAFSRRGSDPFYRLVKVDGDLTEHSDAFVLSIDVPPHEQNNLHVSVAGNELVVSGYRRASDEKKTGEGGKVTTSSYQTFTESYPITYPVDAKNVLRDYDGSTLTITIPKLPSYAKRDPYQAKKSGSVDLVHAERPHFPGNLPLEGEALEKANRQHDRSRKPPQIKSKRTSGRTLG